MSNFLLSYPRSGKRWFLKCVDILLPEVHPFSMVTHLTSDLAHSEYMPNNRLVLLLRNYKECIFSHGTRPPTGKCQQGDYLKNVQFYDNWRGPKMIVHYERLINDPINVLRDVIAFLNELPTRLYSFSLHLKDHFNQSLEECGITRDAYNLRRHNAIRPFVAQQWDSELRALDPEIYDKYLSRYAS